jgi:hypothetical protein
MLTQKQPKSVFSFPTKTNNLLGSDTFTVDPSAVVVAMPKHWVIGALANQQWSIVAR